MTESTEVMARDRGAGPRASITVAPYLVTRYGVTHPKDPHKVAVTGLPEIQRANLCESWRTMRGTCEHGSHRWLHVRCKNRKCPGCSKVRQWQFASKIANGIRQYGVSNCAFLVLTYADPDSADPAFKETAVRQENAFIKWLRKWQTKLGNPDMQYAKTWEIQPNSQRLHTNIIVGPWVYMPHSIIKKRWGSRVSVARVQDDYSVSKEATKARSPDGLSAYLTKIEQAVPAAWHRAISFSKKWPKNGPNEPLTRVGNIMWEPEWLIPPVDIHRFHAEMVLGWWEQTEKGSGEFVDLINPERCRCFDFVADQRLPEPMKVIGEDMNFDDLSEMQKRVLADLLFGND